MTIERKVALTEDHYIVVKNNYSQEDNYGWVLDDTTQRYVETPGMVYIKFSGARPNSMKGEDFSKMSLQEGLKVAIAMAQVLSALKDAKPEDPGRAGLWASAAIGSTVTDGTTSFWVKVGYDSYVALDSEGYPMVQCENDFAEHWYLGKPAEPEVAPEPDSDLEELLDF